MNKVRHSILTAVTNILLFGLFIYTTCECIEMYGDSPYYYFKPLEYTTYALMSLIFYRIYQLFNVQNRKLSIAVSLFVSLLFTVSVWFLNSYFLYLQTTHLYPITFISLLLSNISYNHLYGGLRYPLCFIAMTIICIVLPLLKKKINKFIKDFNGEAL